MAQVKELWVYPLKGARGVQVGSIEVDPVVGVRGDRVDALELIPREGEAPVLLKHGMRHGKKVLCVAMNNPKMAAETPRYDNRAEASHGGHGLHVDYLAGLCWRLKGKLIVHSSDGKTYSFHDTKGGFVSIGNLVTHREFEKFCGRPVDKRRLRMNVWAEWRHPFEEYSLIDKYPGTRIINAPLARFRGDDECERCPAINADPETGNADGLLMELRAFMQTRNHKSPQNKLPQVMGILVAPLDFGVLELNDEIWPE